MEQDFTPFILDESRFNPDLNFILNVFQQCADHVDLHAAHYRQEPISVAQINCEDVPYLFDCAIEAHGASLEIVDRKDEHVTYHIEHHEERYVQPVGEPYPANWKNFIEGMTRKEIVGHVSMMSYSEKMYFALKTNATLTSQLVMPLTILTNFNIHAMVEIYNAIIEPRAFLMKNCKCRFNLPFMPIVPMHCCKFCGHKSIVDEELKGIPDELKEYFLKTRMYFLSVGSVIMVEGGCHYVRRIETLNDLIQFGFEVRGGGAEALSSVYEREFKRMEIEELIPENENVLSDDVFQHAKIVRVEMSMGCPIRMYVYDHSNGRLKILPPYIEYSKYVNRNDVMIDPDFKEYMMSINQSLNLKAGNFCAGTKGFRNARKESDFMEQDSAWMSLKQEVYLCYGDNIFLESHTYGDYYRENEGIILFKKRSLCASYLPISHEMQPKVKCVACCRDRDFSKMRCAYLYHKKWQGLCMSCDRIAKFIKLDCYLDVQFDLRFRYDYDNSRVVAEDLSLNGCGEKSQDNEEERYFERFRDKRKLIGPKRDLKLKEMGLSLKYSRMKLKYEEIMRRAYWEDDESILDAYPEPLRLSLMNHMRDKRSNTLACFMKVVWEERFACYLFLMSKLRFPMTFKNLITRRLPVDYLRLAATIWVYSLKLRVKREFSHQKYDTNWDQGWRPGLLDYEELGEVDRDYYW